MSRTQPKQQHSFRQGDVLISRICSAPKADVHPVQPENGRLILAYGEATGHSHSIPATHGSMTRRDDVLFLTIDQLTEVTHQEHAPITLEPGVYAVERQREWSDAQEPRYVAD